MRVTRSNTNLTVHMFSHHQLSIIPRLPPSQLRPHRCGTIGPKLSSIFISTTKISNYKPIAFRPDLCLLLS